MSYKKITFKQHRELSARTMSTEIEQMCGNHKALLAVHALGLVDEAIEAFEFIGDKSFGYTILSMNKKVMEELGDTLWYLARLYDIAVNNCGLMVPEIEYPTRGSILVKNSDENSIIYAAMMLVETKNIGELIKKYANHGHDFDVQKFVMAARSVMRNIQILLNIYGGYEIRECAAANINKLEKRYPDGFSAERSINRAE